MKLSMDLFYEPTIQVELVFEFGVINGTTEKMQPMALVCPSWAKFFTIDCNGEMWCYEKMPKNEDNWWWGQPLTKIKMVGELSFEHDTDIKNTEKLVFELEKSPIIDVRLEL